MARLMLVTQYAGSKMVYVFAYNETDPDVTATANARTSTMMGKLTVDDGDDETTDTNNTSLRSEGMFYLAGPVDDTNGLTAGDEVAADAEPMAVYSYVDLGNDNAIGGIGGAADTKVYLVMDSQRTEDGTTTYVYRSVDITADASDATVDGTAEEVKVMAAIPEATDYKHIHFGVWAGLSDAEKNGTQTIADLGIGFVQSIGEGLTGDDMPNNGEADYQGNWVAAVRAADPDGSGAITLEHGTATLEADFGDEEITAILTGLATLSGDIAGNEFSGTKATVGTTNIVNLTSGATFTGSFSGGFYGSKAAEAGGVFSFTSEDAEDGEFQGAFGGNRQ
jgi:hypothetical protein